MINIKNKGSLSISLIAVSSVIGFMPNISPIYYSTMGVTLLYNIFISKKYSFNLPIILIIVASIISNLINNPPQYFQSWERLILFIIIAGVVSPLIQTNYFNRLRSNLFYWSLKIAVIISIISFIFYFLGINYMTRGGEILFSTGRFGGLTNHSMILSPLASLSSLYVFNILINKKNKNTQTAILFIVFFISFMVLLIGASRSSLLAMILGIIYIILKHYKNKLSSIIKVIIKISLIGFLLYPLWGGYLAGVIDKQNKNIERGGIMTSRDTKWDARIYEIKTSPIVGVGYSAILPDSGDYFDIQNGQVEPGTSWGAVFSMLGLLGFLPFIYLFISTYINTWKNKNNYLSSLIGSILTFFAIHMQAEGYVFGAGGYMFYLFWLLIGVSVTFNKSSREITDSQTKQN